MAMSNRRNVTSAVAIRVRVRVKYSILTTLQATTTLDAMVRAMAHNSCCKLRNLAANKIKLL